MEVAKQMRRFFISGLLMAAALGADASIKHKRTALHFGECRTVRLCYVERGGPLWLQLEEQVAVYGLMVLVA